MALASVADLKKYMDMNFPGYNLTSALLLVYKWLQFMKLFVERIPRTSLEIGLRIYCDHLTGNIQVR